MYRKTEKGVSISKGSCYNKCWGNEYLIPIYFHETKEGGCEDADKGGIDHSGVRFAAEKRTFGYDLS